MTKGDFQSSVNVAQAPAVAGDFCSKNPRFSYDAGPGGLVAGPGGVIIARFAWATAPNDGDGSPATVLNSGYGLPSGFVHREQQGLNTTYLSSAGMTIPGGFGMTLMIGADLWVVNDGTTEASPGQKAYANFADGKVTFAATASATGGGTSTASTIAAATAVTTGSIADNVMTLTAIGSGTVYPGSAVTGTGVAANTFIDSQLSGTTGGIGTYLLSVGEQTIASETLTMTYGLMTIGGTVVAGFAVNQTVTGPNVAVPTSIIALISGTGAAGTYAVTPTQTAGSAAINSATNIETKYYCRSSGLPGELVKMSPNTLA